MSRAQRHQEPRRRLDARDPLEREARVRKLKLALRGPLTWSQELAEAQGQVERGPLLVHPFSAWGRS